MARATTNDGMRRARPSGEWITAGQAAAIARRAGIELREADVEAMCDGWPGEFECIPSVPWSETMAYDGWVWLIDFNDFTSWVLWEVERRERGA